MVKGDGTVEGEGVLVQAAMVEGGWLLGRLGHEADGAGHGDRRSKVMESSGGKELWGRSTRGQHHKAWWWRSCGRGLWLCVAKGEEKAWR